MSVLPPTVVLLVHLLAIVNLAYKTFYDTTVMPEITPYAHNAFNKTYNTLMY